MSLLTAPATRRSLLPTHRGPSADRPALISTSGAVLSHVRLGEMVEELAARLPDVGSGRRLVHVPLRPDVDSVTGYLATLAAGHAALVTPAAAETILGRYRPDLVATGDPDRPFEVRSTTPQHLLHPELSLLLSTSGSTGSPKLVRLAHRNILSNASAIAAALRLTEHDRALTSLPLHYCFGLSVLHSHLVAGASVVLHDGSLLARETWNVVDRLGVTTLAVVPHSVELMESTGVLNRPHPSLRLIAQAGGRMPRERVLRTAALGREHGWGLAVMYGQTEATARICVLDPTDVARHPDAVGRPVAGTSVRVDPTVPEAADGVGEVLVRGSGVMMGYAEHPDDLALGAMLTELRTGDLGTIGDDGLLRLHGRRSGFVKVMGLRVDVARVEEALTAAGLTACVNGDEDGLTVAVQPQPGTPAATLEHRARDLAARASGLGPAAVHATAMDLPRLPSGKLDRPLCAALVKSTRVATTRETRAGGGVPSLATDVATAIRHVLGRDAIDLRRTFVQHGGDSLSHVQASVRLEGLLGPLPPNWHHRPLAELVELGTTRANHLTASRWSSDQPRGWWSWRVWHSVEASVAIRAVAVVLILGSHADLFTFRGGAHTLLAVAGFNAARFGLSAPTVGGRWRAGARTLVGVAVPTIVVALIGMANGGRYGWGNVLLVNWLTGPVSQASHNEFWFVDTLLACTATITAVLSIPAASRAWRRHPWRVAMILTTLALVPRFVILNEGEGLLRGMMPTTIWLFTLGAAAAHADTGWRRGLTLVLAVVGGVGFFPADPARNAVVIAGIVALTLLRSVRLPAPAVPVVSLLAAASLYIYLVQFQIITFASDPLTGAVLSLATGCLLWRLADGPVRRLQGLVPLPTNSNERLP
ncbi:MAG: AMP-binding protein [Propionibacteriaceae bacterium]|uniref:AMP-binding protein n=1 Tax=Propionicimonas sp. T2.31MG-18 TaxID=3157620 RepID=UPI001D9158B9|nr:AMP-binding protein [Actinomycetota bacterium]MCB0911672.1 AMP-binding protein [Propionibacteriaceae bacterium]